MPIFWFLLWNLFGHLLVPLLDPFLIHSSAVHTFPKCWPRAPITLPEHISGRIWTYLLISGLLAPLPIFRLSGLICSHLAYLDISGRICLYLGISGRIWTHLGVSAYIWAYQGAARHTGQPTNAAHKRHVPKWGGGGVTPHGVFNILHIWTYLHISGHIWAYLLIFGISGHICTYLLYLDISWRSCLYLAYLDLSRHTLCTWEYLAVSAHMWHIWAYLCISVYLWAYLAYLGDEIIYIYIWSTKGYLTCDFTLQLMLTRLLW